MHEIHSLTILARAVTQSAPALDPSVQIKHDLYRTPNHKHVNHPITRSTLHDQPAQYPPTSADRRGRVGGRGGEEGTRHPLIADCAMDKGARSTGLQVYQARLGTDLSCTAPSVMAWASFIKTDIDQADGPVDSEV